MSNKSFFQTIITASFMLLVTFLNAQQPPTMTWDFEEGCSDPSNSFFLGCIGNAFSASGTPDNAGSQGIPAFSGSLYAHMYANYCFDQGAPSFHHSEGIVLEYPFQQGKPVRITFSGNGNSNAPHETKFILTNSLTNSGGYNNPPTPPCLNPNDVLPNIPHVSNDMKTFTKTDFPDNAWHTKTFTWTPTANFNQMWIRPKAISEASNGAANTHLFIDKVIISDACAPVNYSVSACRYNGSSQVVVTLNGDPVTQSNWVLATSPNCNVFSVGNFVNINWISANSFVLPYNSGCYLLTGNISPAPGCPQQVVRFLVRTAGEGVGVCTGPCDDWILQSAYEECIEFFFHVAPNPGLPPLPAGTIYTFTVDGVVRQSGPDADFSALVKGANGLSNGYHNVCVTVAQPGCPSITKCTSIHVDCFKGAGEDRSKDNYTELSDLRISNPAQGTVWLSRVITEGMVNIYAIQGQFIKSIQLNNTDQLDIADLSEGQYIVEFNVVGQRITRLLMVIGN